MKKIFMSTVLLFSVAASYGAEQPRWFDDGLEELPEGQQQAPAHGAIFQTNEEIMAHFNGASFMRDFLSDGDKIVEREKKEIPAQDDAR